MTEFLRLVDERDARVVFSGDTRQIQSVEAGDALRILEKESRLKSIALTQVQRQTQLEYRDAIQELRRDPERGFEKLDAMGAVREVSHADRAQEVARQYSAALETQASVLVVCATHNEIEQVTSATRYNKGAMAIHLEAVYEQGVLRPLEPLALAEHQRVHVTVDERKRPLSWESAQQPDDSRAELDWLANESRHYSGEWVALDGNRLLAHGPKLAAVKSAAQAAGVSRPFFASVPDDDLPFGGW